MFSALAAAMQDVETAASSGTTIDGNFGFSIRTFYETSRAASPDFTNPLHISTATNIGKKGTLRSGIRMTE
jgi:hypothetical protein